MDLEKIEKLAELKEKGIITDEEYAEAKAKILRGQDSKLTTDLSRDMDSRTYAMLLHFSQLCGFVLPVFGWVLPVVLWIIKRDDPYIDQQGKVVFNWILSSFIYFVISVILSMVIIGIFMLLALAIVSVIFIVIGAVRAKDGVIQNYPLSISFFPVAALATKENS